MAVVQIAGEITDAQLKSFADLVYETTGIRFTEKKKTLITNRLRKRLRENQISCFDEYFSLLKKHQDHPEHPEWNAFIEKITTHETYLFRDQQQWEWLRDKMVLDWKEEAETGTRDYRLRIWSAACSRGDEVYTIAISLAQSLSNLEKWDVKILGTDIGIETLEQARTAKFSDHSMRKVADEVSDKYFIRNIDGTRSPKPRLKKMVEFQYHNLIFPLNLEESFDLVFLKNVLIYFDTDSKKVVIENIFKQLKPGGYLVLGPAEGATNLLDGFQRSQSTIYRKVAE